VKDSFGTDTPPPENELVAEEEANLHSIVTQLREKVPLQAILPTERTLWPEYGIESDCKAESTVHVDSFLYDDDEVDELVEQGLLSRHYCRACGAHSTAPLTFISHSLGRQQLRYIFKALLPQEMLQGKTILDVGSRLGAVLFAGFFYSPARLVGVEMNEELAKLQKDFIENHEMGSRLAIVQDDIRNQPQIVEGSDVIVLNNVFQFFLPPQDQVLCWEFLKSHSKKGTVLVTNPSLDALTDHLQLSFTMDQWVDKPDTQLTAAKYAGTDSELFEDLTKICLYQVK
jgi:hypothetical protein